MLEKLTNFFKACQSVKQSLRMAIQYEKCEDWSIFILHADSGAIIFLDNDCSLTLLCARAYIALEEWAREFPELENIEINLK